MQRNKNNCRSQECQSNLHSSCLRLLPPSQVCLQALVPRFFVERFVLPMCPLLVVELEDLHFPPPCMESLCVTLPSSIPLGKSNNAKHAPVLQDLEGDAFRVLVALHHNFLGPFMLDQSR